LFTMPRNAMTEEFFWLILVLFWNIPGNIGCCTSVCPIFRLRRSVFGSCLAICCICRRLFTVVLRHDNHILKTSRNHYFQLLELSLVSIEPAVGGLTFFWNEIHL
jgi:hypothetical protein